MPPDRQTPTDDDFVVSEISNDLPTVKIPVEETKKQAYNAFERLGEEVGRVTNGREPEPLSMNEPCEFHRLQTPNIPLIGVS